MQESIQSIYYAEDPVSQAPVPRLKEFPQLLLS